LIFASSVTTSPYLPVLLRFGPSRASGRVRSFGGETMNEPGTFLQQRVRLVESPWMTGAKDIVSSLLVIDHEDEQVIGQPLDKSNVAVAPGLVALHLLRLQVIDHEACMIFPQRRARRLECRTRFTVDCAGAPIGKNLSLGWVHWPDGQLSVQIQFFCPVGTGNKGQRPMRRARELVFEHSP